MSRNISMSLAAAALIAFGGAAFAQEGGDTAPDTTTPDTTMPERSAPERGMTGQDKMTMPTKDLVGKNLVNAQGETIGDIEAIEGNSLIVGVGGFLGLGERRVAIPWDQVQMMGSGENAKVQTNMTKAQVKALPEYKNPEKKM